jgi:hypothetical protein
VELAPRGRYQLRADRVRYDGPMMAQPAIKCGGIPKQSRQPADSRVAPVLVR